ncbi:hypothetical protein NPIL_580391, partial [Nephila pilipes]
SLRRILRNDLSVLFWEEND